MELLEQEFAEAGLELTKLDQCSISELSYYDDFSYLDDLELEIVSKNFDVTIEVGNDIL